MTFKDKYLLVQDSKIVGDCLDRKHADDLAKARVEKGSYVEIYSAVRQATVFGESISGYEFDSDELAETRHIPQRSRLAPQYSHDEEYPDENDCDN